VQLTNKGPVISDSDIRRIESTCRVVMPRAYREWLLVNNGGCPDPNSFAYVDFRGHNGDDCLDVLLGIDRQERCENIVDQIFELQWLTRIRSIPVGITACSGILCVGHD